MSVVFSLLRAIDRADGEALVMHVGEKPYVVTATGHAELAANALTVPAMTGMLEQLLPADSRQALDEIGAVEYHLPAEEASPGTRYSVVAARGGDDIWIEVRRRKQPVEPAPAPAPAVPPAPPVAPVAAARPPYEPPRAAQPAPTPAPLSVVDQPEPQREAPEPALYVEAEASAYEAPAGEPAVYETPTYDPPAYEAPAYETPGYEMPGYQAPAAVTFDAPPDYGRFDSTRADQGPIRSEEIESPAVATQAAGIFDEPAALVPEPAAAPVFEEPVAAPAESATQRVFAEPASVAPEHALARVFDEPARGAAGPAGAAEPGAPFTPAGANASAPSADETTVPADLDRGAYPEVREREGEPSAAAAHEEHRFVVRDVADRFELRLQTEDDFYDGADDEDDSDVDVPQVDERTPVFDFTIDPEPAPVPVSFRAPAPPQRVSIGAETPWPAAAIPAIPLAVPSVSSAPLPPPSVPQIDPLHRLLKVAAVQGASALYVGPQSRPSLRVDGEMRVLEEPPMTAGQLETELRSLVAANVGDDAPLPLGEFETRELQGVGRVQCLLFRDHRGLGAIFRMLPGRTVSAQKAGLSAGIQSLCTEPEGLLLVAGSAGSGKSTLVAALVDQINRTRRDHVITVETDIQFVHENHTSFISQREARDERAFLEAVRGAIREAPDVVVIDGVMNADVASTVLEAAGHGLVVASLAASTTASALERFVGLVGGDRPDVRALVSEHLRGVVTQALLRKTGGGRAAAREVLVNVPAVAALVANAQLGQLQTVLNGGRRIGMVPLNDALVELVQSGALDVRQAHRKSPDPSELVSMLGKAGFDTTFAENLG